MLKLLNGDNSGALDELESMCDSYQIPFNIKSFEIYDALRSEPRFNDLLEKNKLIVILKIQSPKEKISHIGSI